MRMLVQYKQKRLYQIYQFSYKLKTVTISLNYYKCYKSYNSYNQYGLQSLKCEIKYTTFTYASEYIWETLITKYPKKLWYNFSGCS